MTFQDVAKGPLLQPDVKPNMKTLGPKFGPRLKEVQAAIAVASPAWLVEKIQAGQPFDLTAPNGPATLEPADLVLQLKAPEGWAGAADRGVQVLVNTLISDDLYREGLAREVVRHIQDSRKKADLDMANRIEVHLIPDSDTLRQAIETHRGYIGNETLVQRWADANLDGTAFQTQVSVDGCPLTIQLRKAPS